MSTDEDVIRAAVRVLMSAALDALQADPHSWSEQPCQTCRTVSAIVGRSFGCYRYAEERIAQRRTADAS